MTKKGKLTTINEIFFDRKRSLIVIHYLISSFVKKNYKIIKPRNNRLKNLTFLHSY